MKQQYEREEEIMEVLKGFETCTTDKTQFKHRQHLTVAVAYLQTLPVDAALTRMRTNLLRFLDHYGVPREKYSEEVTLFWLEQVSLQLQKVEPELSLAEKCNYVIEALKDVRSE